MISNPAAPTSALLGRPTGDLLLRVCGTRYDGRVIRLSSPKCTVGSGDRCTLRLKARGVDPMHCLILRGPDRTIVRRWSPNTRLNGRTFQDAPLYAGDRLSIGNLEFEVLDEARAGVEYGEAATGNPANSARVAQLEQENRLLVTTLADARRQKSDGQQNVEAERRARDLELTQRRRQLDELQAQFEARKRALDKAESVKPSPAEAGPEALEKQAEIEAHVSQQRSEVEASLRELNATRQAFESEQQKWSEVRRHVEESLETRSAAIEAADSELTSRSRRLDELEDTLAARMRDFEKSAAELNTRRQELEAAQETWATRAAKNEALAKSQLADSSQADEEDDSPADASDVFARLREMSLLKDESAASQPATASEESPAPKSTPAVARPSAEAPVAKPKRPAADESGEEESIEDYMAQLINRLQGGNAKTPVTPVWSQPSPDEDDDAPAPTFKPAQSAAAAEQVPSWLAPEEFIPRSAAPELSSNLSAMRELANLSARTAIFTHSTNTTFHTAIEKIILAGIAFVVGIVLLGWYSGEGMLPLAGGYIGLIIAGAWTWQGVALFRKTQLISRAGVGGSHKSGASALEAPVVKPSPIVKPQQPDNG